jgi:hypothetical protein
MMTGWWKGAEATGERREGGREDEIGKGGQLLKMWNREEVMEQMGRSIDSFVVMVAYPSRC